MIARTAFLALLLSGTSAFAQKQQIVAMSEKGDRIEITISDQPFAVLQLNKDGKLPKPFMSPVRGPGGTVLTRKIYMVRKDRDSDHPHHKGIWVAVDEVNGVKFWAEKGKIVTRSAKVEVDPKRSQVIHIVNEWRNASGETQVVEDTKIDVTPDRVVSYDITFKAEKKPAEFHDTKEGLFGFRMVKSMQESQGGKVVSSSGKTGTKTLWGKTADWIDYTGEVDGKTFGVAIFDHPKNFRKSRYHVRNYGLFSINPWGEKSYAKNPVKPTVLKTGESLRLRYAMYIHAGDANAAKVGSVYKRWVREAGK